MEIASAARLAGQSDEILQFLHEAVDIGIRIMAEAFLWSHSIGQGPCVSFCRINSFQQDF